MNLIRIPYYMRCIILLFLLSACGSNQQASDTGSISFKLQLSRPTTTSRAAAATSTNICTDYGIMTINANVVTSSGVEVAAEYWSCENHAGIIQNVPAGDEYTVTITGTLTGGIIAWHGEKSGVSVSAGGLPTPTGVITMTYTGNDKKPPEIKSSTPSSDTDAPVTTMITAIFSKKMAASSVNDSTFTLQTGATLVSGSVVYDANAQRSMFIPLNNLSYSTTYTATITKDVEDMAENKMESDYSWSFITESQPTTRPSAPTGIIAASGNSQNTITWDAVPAATSYNIYWSTTSGVTTATGTKISDITTTSYTHTDLTNGTTYYYIVTSTNSYGESVESYEVSSAPGSIDTSPPTGSITINNNAVYTTSTDVTLSLSSSSTRGVSQMCISNTTTCSSWESYTTSKSWTLTTGDGTRFVYAWFKDSAGTSNTSPYFAVITLDTTPPSDGTITATAENEQVSLSWSEFSDATSGIGSYKLVYSTIGTPDSCSSGTQVNSGSDTSYTHTGLNNGTTYYYRVCAIDNAGNVSAGSSGSAIPNPPARLPKTGQTTCYDSSGNVNTCARTGQDGDLQRGVAWPNPRFIDNGDGTVTDNLTGLIWTKDGKAPGPPACSPGVTKQWQAALDYVDCLNANSYLGYMDWRLPNVNELRSLVHAGQVDTAAWLNTQDFNNVQGQHYWYSTSYSSGASDAWYVGMGDGGMGGGGKFVGNYLSVWPVRSGQSIFFGDSLISLPKTGQTTCYDNSGNVIVCAGTGQDGDIQAGVPWPSQRFTDNGDGTVTDKLTGLVWTKDGNSPGPPACSPATNKTWLTTLDYVACLNANSYLGYTDWRWPNVNELRSLAHAGQVDTAAWLNTQGFNNVGGGDYWSSMSLASNSVNAWVVNMGDGSAAQGYKSYYGGRSVWPVRSGQ